MRRVIREEERLFRDQQLTKEEAIRFQKNKELLQLAETRARKMDQIIGYRMPENYVNAEGKIDRDKKMDVLTARYKPEVSPLLFSPLLCSALLSSPLFSSPLLCSLSLPHRAGGCCAVRCGAVWWCPFAL